LFILPLTKFHVNPFNNSYFTFGRTDGQTGTTVLKIFRSMGCFVVSSVSILGIRIYERYMNDIKIKLQLQIMRQAGSQSISVHYTIPVMTQPPCRPVTLDTHRSGQQWRHRHTASCPRGITDWQNRLITAYVAYRCSSCPYWLTCSSG